MESKGVEGVTETWPRKKEAKDYLEKHKIIELLNNLTGQLIYHQPSESKHSKYDISVLYIILIIIDLT